MNNVFAGLGEQLRERPGHAYVESVRHRPAARARTREEMQRFGRAPKVEMPEVDNPWGLTPSQCAVIAAIACGMSFKAIAIAMGITVKTVEGHATKVRKQMDVRTTIEAAVKWGKAMDEQTEEAVVRWRVERNTRPAAVIVHDHRTGDIGMRAVQVMEIGAEK